MARQTPRELPSQLSDDIIQGPAALHGRIAFVPRMLPRDWGLQPALPDFARPTPDKIAAGAISAS